jgi:predicted dehydrogenase
MTVTPALQFGLFGIAAYDDADAPLSAADADELLAAVTGSGVASVVFSTNRFVPAVEQMLRDAIAAGGWHGARGTVLFAVFGDGSPYAESSWRRIWGGLWDPGPHVLSLVLPVRHAPGGP